MGEWKNRSIIFELDTTWRLVVSFTPLLLYPRGKSPSLDRSLSESQNSSGGYVYIYIKRERNIGEPQMSVNWSVKYSLTFVRYFFIT
jgi:hypothetical protein